MAVKAVAAVRRGSVAGQTGNVRSSAAATAVAPDQTESPRGFRYWGRDANGVSVKNARIPFTTAAESGYRLKLAGITVEKLAPISSAFAFLDYKKNQKPTVLDMANLADQIAAQYTTGLSYDKICRILGRVHPKSQIRAALNSAADMITDGKPVYIAFGSQMNNKGKPFFPPTFVYAFQIGEKIGALPDPETGISGDAPVIMLRFFSKAQRKASAISKAIVKGLINPAAILLSCLAVFFIQVYFIVPQFAEIFVGLLAGKDTSLPLPTQIMVSISEFFYSPLGMTVAVLLLAALVGGGYYFTANRKGIELRGRLVLRLPLLKSFFLPYNASVFCRNLSIMYADANVMTRFETIAETTMNPVFREFAEHCKEQLLVNAPPFNELINGHLHLLGEAFAPVAETIEANPGQAQTLLYTYAKALEEEAEEKLAISIATLKQVSFILAAAMTLFILIASYAPLLTMVSRLSGGK